MHFTDDDDYADATLTWFLFVTQRIKMGRISATYTAWKTSKYDH